MKVFLAFMKKEFLSQFRTGRVLIFGILFLLLGVMNPAIAKLTPVLFELLADSIAESGMTITPQPVTAMDSWVQFYKNIPLGLIAFVIFESGIFTREYRTGTLVLSLTKGLERYKVVVAKTLVLSLIWSAGYWLCFGISYGGSAYFFDNSVVQNLAFSAVCWWLFGLWVISLMILFSTAARSNIGVLIGTGSVVIAFSVISMLPKINEYLPTLLSDGTSLIYGAIKTSSYFVPIIIVFVSGITCLAASIPVFNKKQL